MKQIRLWIILFSGLFLSLSANAQYGFPSFADLAEKLIPTVVNISTIQQPDQINIPAYADDDTEEYYDPLEGRVALGSGFIISEEGYIITNYHVIENAEVINVVLFDNTEIEADIIGGDEKTDIALIKIDPPFELDKVAFGDSDAIRVGDWVLSIGNPFGLGGSVSAGIVSAKSRDIAAGPYDNFIQTDAAINQGSSGGPLFNTRGEVVGINSALFSTSGNNMGVGFAIPINTVNWIVKQLEQSGEVKRGWIGVKIQPNNDEIAASLGLKALDGVLVSGLSDGASAATAGIVVGDVILSFDGHPIDNTKNLSRMVAETQIGRKVTIELWRNKQPVPLQVEILEMPDEPEETPQVVLEEISDNQTDDVDGLIEELDIRFDEISPELMDKYSISPDAKGVVITEILPGADAEKKGLRVGDVVAKIDKKDVFTLADVRNFVNEAKMENNRPVLLLIQDKGLVHFAALKLKESK